MIDAEAGSASQLIRRSFTSRAQAERWAQEQIDRGLRVVRISGEAYFGFPPERSTPTGTMRPTRSDRAVSRAAADRAR